MSMPQMKIISRIELITLLRRCATLLERAYQENLEKDFFQVSMDANMASQRLEVELELYEPRVLH
ncbi:MAG: hypothetical protein QM652_05175 [Legionella sp.]|uniref:hypothetical protein n=1 Tax=Legionella sp. TaxID=459 RepID=UPI0039E701B4